MKRFGVVLLSLLGAFVVVTWAALEAGGVAIVETLADDGTTRATHVWFVDTAGGGEPRLEPPGIWLEAGTPENPWFVDAQWQPQLSFSADGYAATEYTAIPIRDAETQRHLRERLRAKYGWRDAWVSMFVDGSGTIPVRLEPTER